MEKSLEIERFRSTPDIKNEDLCRLCAFPMECDEKMKYDNDLFEQNNLLIHQQIKDLAGLIIENEPGIPRFFCENCKSRLLQAHAFRQCLVDAQEFFQKDYKKSLDEEPNSSFDTIFVPEKIAENNLNINLMPEDLCEPENDDLDDFDCIEEFETKEKRATKTKTKKSKSKSKKFLTYKKRKDKRTDADEKGDTFICEQCGNSFKTMKFLEIHAVRHEEKKFECDVCSAKFYLPTELKRHKISHTGEKPVSCRYCDTRFLNKSNRNRHEKSQHLKLRPHHCEICGKGFANTHLRKNHMVVHTKERAFDCKLCQKSFLRKNHLVTHYKSTAHKKNEVDTGNIEISSTEIFVNKLNTI